MTLTQAISYVTNLFSDNADFSALSYYMYDLPTTDNTSYLFMSDIIGDWEITLTDEY